MTKLTIGQVAKQSGASVDTIRFYEREKLIAPESRKDSGYRQFHPQVINSIVFIRHAKNLGFTLKEISELLFLREDPSAKACDVKQKAEAKIADIDAKINQLSQIRKELLALSSSCSGYGPATECPILEGIESL